MQERKRRTGRVHRAGRIMAFLLTLFLVLGIVPMIPAPPVQASYDDGEECWLCGHYHWDSYMCGLCGACSDECDEDCHNRSHCEWCGDCLLDKDFCDESHICMECLIEDGWHCPECEACFCGDNDGLCVDCYRCDSCAGTICEDCGLCEDCAAQEGDVFHCEECGACIMTVDFCEYAEGNSAHCVDCHIICEQCDRCNIEDDLEICEFCGLCEDCCWENAIDAGCDCGDYCIEDSAFEEHLCSECGTCFDMVEQCEFCDLCMDCCAANSECSMGICVEDPDYEEHFCEDCGKCFCEVDQCDSCYSEGPIRCVECCEELCEEAGCSCGGWCYMDEDFRDHLSEEHYVEEVFEEHECTPHSRYSYNESYHWLDCRYCTEDEHVTGFGEHVLNEAGCCEVCDYAGEKELRIISEPRDASNFVTDLSQDEYTRSPYAVTFKVAAVGAKPLTYTWYYRQVGETGYHTINGADGDRWTLTRGNKEPLAKCSSIRLAVPKDACYKTYEVWCAVRDANDNVVGSRKAKLTGKCNYVYQNVPNGEETKIYREDGTRYTFTHSDGHFRKCSGCGETIGKLEKDHTFGTAYYCMTDVYGQDWMWHKCTKCGYYEYIKKHEHNYDTFEVDEEHSDDTYHAIRCSIEGCDHVTKELHHFGPRIVQYPSSGQSGAFLLECVDCGYTKNDPNPDHFWTKDNYLGNVYRCGMLSKTVFTKADELTIRVNYLKIWARVSNMAYVNKKITGWKAVCTYYDSNMNKGTMDATNYFTFTKQDNGDWKVKMSRDLRMGGSRIDFEPILADCEHKKTMISNAKDPVCNLEGYTGDTICADCGKLVKTGDPIQAVGAFHTGTLTYIQGTKRTGSCTERGFEGYFSCSACGEKVAGKTTGFDHSRYTQNTVSAKAATCTEEGYSGDKYCSHCGKLSQRGYRLPAEHKDTVIINQKAATYTEKGYSGDTYCNTCNKIVKEGYSLPKLKVTEITGWIRFETSSLACEGDKPSDLINGLKSPVSVVLDKDHTVITDSSGNKVTSALVGGKKYTLTVAFNMAEGYTLGDRVSNVKIDGLPCALTYSSADHCYKASRETQARTYMLCPELEFVIPNETDQAAKDIYVDENWKDPGEFSIISISDDYWPMGVDDDEGTGDHVYWFDATEGPETPYTGTFEANHTYGLHLPFYTIGYNVVPKKTSDRVMMINDEKVNYQESDEHYYTDFYFTMPDHGWDEGYETKEPTKTEEGEVVYTCEFCGLERHVVIPRIIEGQAKDGWELIGTYWYYGKDGNYVTGWQYINSKYYYFDDNGKMYTGWLYWKNAWYYLKPGSGQMVKGWNVISGKLYFFQPNGSMYTGWKQEGDIWYYLIPGKGNAAQGWQKVSGKYYYFNTKCEMVTGWQVIGGEYYYFWSDGAMASNEYVGGYRLDADGVWRYKPKAEWAHSSKGWYFYDSTGWYAKDESWKINRKVYYFDKDGYCLNP